MFRRLENAILRLVFANTVFHKRALLVIIHAEYKESLLNILSHLESTLGPSWLSPEKNFQNKVLRRMENAMLRLVFAFFQLI